MAFHVRLKSFLIIALTHVVLLITGQTITTSSVSSPIPTLFGGDSQYQLLGCYNELGPDASGRAIGISGSYVNPLSTSPDTLTVPLCLGSCGMSLTPNGTGIYSYAAVENSRECYCGLTLSNLSSLHLPYYCSSPCAADTSMSCGGYGYLTLYELRSLVSSTRPSSTQLPPNASSTSSPATQKETSTSSDRRKHREAKGISISVGLASLCLLLALLLWWKRKRRARVYSSPTELPFVGGYTLSQYLRRTASRKVVADTGMAGERSFLGPQDLRSSSTYTKDEDMTEAQKKSDLHPMSAATIRESVTISDSPNTWQSPVDRSMDFTHMEMERWIGPGEGGSASIHRVAELPSISRVDDRKLSNGGSDGILRREELEEFDSPTLSDYRADMTTSWARHMEANRE